jgi:sulfite reductase (NADPH) flavoprotein alpha-component
MHKGVASGYLGERRTVDNTILVYRERNENFRLPANAATPIIMVGAGTGIAPFRAFLQEREAAGSSGRSWLFFGDRHFRTDFLYQIEWQRLLKDGALSRMDVAFSRDQESKVYVQHRLMERGKDIYAWLEDGATLYVCGDANHMAPDVHEALLAVVAREGRKSREQAEEYFQRLQQEKRYQRDVY